jgi:hypothetical protein
MKQPHLRLVQDNTHTEPSAPEPPPVDRAAIIEEMHQYAFGWSEVTYGFERDGTPFVGHLQGGLASPGEIRAVRKFLDLYLQICPDARTIAHSNGGRCNVPDCEHCLRHEVERRLGIYWSHVATLHPRIQEGEVGLVQVGDACKVVASKAMAARVRDIERTSKSTVRCLHRIRTNDQYALKYLWLNTFAYFLFGGREQFLLPAQAIEYFKAQGSVEIQRDGNGNLAIPDRYKTRDFGVPLPEYPVLQGDRWEEAY